MFWKAAIAKQVIKSKKGRTLLTLEKLQNNLIFTNLTMIFLNIPKINRATFTWKKEQFMEPTKGAIAIWYGLESNGYLQYDSSHGGCPILSGSKWILNKWIYYFDQWKNYPCQLNLHREGFSTSSYQLPFKGSHKNSWISFVCLQICNTK